MNTPKVPKFNGLATELKKHGYTTLYFTTHDKEFDNVGGFLSYNDFDRIISQKDYPAEAVHSTLGVLDHFMFDYMLNVLNKNNEQPFFVAAMTAANHKPYTLPPDSVFSSRFSGIEDQIIAYEDWALARFFKYAAQQQWYANTLFVIVADHGHYFPSPYAMPLSLNHSPLYIFDPSAPKTQIFHHPVVQLDIPETVLSYLKLSHINHTFGINAFSGKRPYAYFVQDNNIGVINNRYYLMWINANAQAQLIDLKKRQPVANDSLKKVMEEYGKTMLQAAQQLILKDKTYFQ
jgi:phosphoglycerol transferase MdoB-like AlkP superfamily enzyme